MVKKSGLAPQTDAKPDEYKAKHHVTVNKMAKNKKRSEDWIKPNTGHQKNTGATKQLSQKLISILHFIFRRLMMMSWCLMSSDVIWHIRDKLWPMPKHGSIKSTYVRCMRV